MKAYLFVPESVPLLLFKVLKLFGMIVAYLRLEMVEKFTFLPLCIEKKEKTHQE